MTLEVTDCYASARLIGALNGERFIVILSADFHGV
jgi:hypothetical protein